MSMDKTFSVVLSDRDSAMLKVLISLNINPIADLLDQATGVAVVAAVKTIAFNKIKLGDNVPHSSSSAVLCGLIMLQFF